MAKRNRVKVDSEETELNMTPMLDVVFILLIFFIVTSVFVKTTGIEVEKPITLLEKDLTPGILIAVNSEDEVWIDKRPYSLAESRPAILALRDENPKASAIIYADRNSKAGIVMGVQDILVDLGVPTRFATD